MRNTSIERVMTTDPTAVTPETPVAAVQSLLEFGELHHLPVISDGKLVGIVSSADLLKLYLMDGSSHAPKAVKISSIMVPAPKTLPRTATLRDAALALSTGSFHALPVVDDDMTLVGIVTSSDLGIYLLRHLPSGDGSLPEDSGVSDAVNRGPLRDAEFLSGLAALKAASPDDPVANFARALVAEHRSLEQVRKAAEHYLRSGHAAREQSVLEKALADARGLPEELSL